MSSTSFGRRDMSPQVLRCLATRRFRRLLRASGARVSGWRGCCACAAHGRSGRHGIRPGGLRRKGGRRRHDLRNERLAQRPLRETALKADPALVRRTSARECGHYRLRATSVVALLNDRSTSTPDRLPSGKNGYRVTQTGRTTRVRQVSTAMTKTDADCFRLLPDRRLGSFHCLRDIDHRGPRFRMGLSYRRSSLVHGLRTVGSFSACLPLLPLTDRSCIVAALVEPIRLRWSTS